MKKNENFLLCVLKFYFRRISNNFMISSLNLLFIYIKGTEIGLRSISRERFYINKHN